MSLTLHALLPPGLWQLFRAAPEAVGPVLFTLHLGFPIVLLVTWRRWWSLRRELAWLLLANHAVTFAVGAMMAIALA